MPRSATVDERIEQLKVRLGVTRKIDVVRAGLDLLDEKAARLERIARWRRVTRRVAAESRRVNEEFRSNSRLKRSGT